jgi:hypothetical protein
MNRRSLGLALIAISACSSSGSPLVPNAPFHPTTAKGDVPLSQLTPDQVGMVCEEQMEYVVALLSSAAGREAQCESQGRLGAPAVAGQQLAPGASVTDADLQRACQSLVDSCLRAPPGPIVGPPTLDCSGAMLLTLTDCQRGGRDEVTRLESLGSSASRSGLISCSRSLCPPLVQPPLRGLAVPRAKRTRSSHDHLPTSSSLNSALPLYLGGVPRSQNVT